MHKFHLYKFLWAATGHSYIPACSCKSESGSRLFQLPCWFLFLLLYQAASAPWSLWGLCYRSQLRFHSAVKYCNHNPVGSLPDWSHIPILPPHNSPARFRRRSVPFDMQNKPASDSDKTQIREFPERYLPLPQIKPVLFYIPWKFWHLHSSAQAHSSDTDHNKMQLRDSQAVRGGFFYWHTDRNAPPVSDTCPQRFQPYRLRSSDSVHEEAYNMLHPILL